MENSQQPSSQAIEPNEPVKTKGCDRAVFAAGCFWGVQAAFDKVPGVKATIVGYTGGHTKHPTYKQVCTDKTGHAEAVLLEYDSSRITYQQLLDIFWQIHNPTTLNRQGPDVGSQYRSAVFYYNEKQKTAAETSMRNLQNSGRFEKPIVTEIKPASAFYQAEDYHQKYFLKNPNAACHIPDFVIKSDKITKTDEQWKKQLTKLQYEVARKKATEPPFSGKYDNFFEKGTYKCICCGAELFSSDTKFDAGCGWPSFYKSAWENNIEQQADTSHGMIRTEVICSRCGAHLGHLFSDGPAPTGLRYCINSASLDFENSK